MSRIHHWLVVGLLALGALVAVATAVNHQTSAKHTAKTTLTTKVKSKTPRHKKKRVAKTVDWTKPSQSKAYPTVTAENPVVLTVSLKKQRVAITQANKRVYTMYCSTGMDDSTPHGTFHVIDRGAHFYNPSEKMGANYWTSFIGTTYLFHTVPTDEAGQYITKEAKYLGKRPSSHGCVRLSIPDAQWINQHIPNGTTVIIK